MDRLAQHFIEAEPRHPAGTVFGVEIARTRGWWLHPLAIVFGGGLLGRVAGKPGHRLRDGLQATAVLGAVTGLHQIGHMATARIVDAPMDTLLVTPIRIYTLYDDTGKTISRGQHIGRAIGGPAANIGFGLGALVLSTFVKCRFVRFFGIISALVGLGALTPFAGNDGEELFRPGTDEQPACRAPSGS